MLKGKILLIALAIMLVASVANAAIFKYSFSTLAEGTVVASDGTAADITTGPDAGTYDAVGIVIQNDGTDALVANSGYYEMTGAVAGTEYTYDASGALTAVTGTPAYYEPVVAIGVDAGLVLITIDIEQASKTEYTFTNVTTSEVGFLGIPGESPETVQEAIDAIDTFLRDITATLFGYSSTTTSAALTTTYATVVTIDPTDFLASGAADIASGDDFLITFTGVFDDQGTNNGAVIDVQFFDGAGALGTATEIILVDRDFYQEQSVAMQFFGTATADVDLFHVQARDDATYDGGRFISGNMTVERF